MSRRQLAGGMSPLQQPSARCLAACSFFNWVVYSWEPLHRLERSRVDGAQANHGLGADTCQIIIAHTAFLFFLPSFYPLPHTRSGEGNTFICCYAYLLHKHAPPLGRKAYALITAAIFWLTSRFFFINLVHPLSPFVRCDLAVAVRLS